MNAAAKTVLTAARMFDGVKTEAQTNSALLLNEERIEAVGPVELIKNAAGPTGIYVDYGDACLSPGLIDGHTHTTLAADGRSYKELFSESDEMMALIGVMNLQIHLLSGVTTVREHGSRNNLGFTLREGLQRGYFAGPRMLVSGRPITQPDGHFHFCNGTAHTEQEIRSAIRQLVAEGADYVKIMASGGGTEGTDPSKASYSSSELAAAVHEAHHLGVLTAAHCRATESMALALKAGVDLMEHAEFLSNAGTLAFDPKIAQQLADDDIFISPTLQAWTNFPRIVELSTRRSSGRFGLAQEAELQRLLFRKNERLEIMRQLLDYGIHERIVPGTDSGPGLIAFGHMDYDLQLLVEAGLSAGDALIAATRTSAHAIGRASDLGTLEPGKIADVAVFAGDPTQDISQVSQVQAVYSAGRLVHQED
jgi:imidazolonepropionase-like amidohydrolase